MLREPRCRCSSPFAISGPMRRATALPSSRRPERLVVERGADCMTMDQVACAAEVGKGTLFRHFGDRCGLLRALLDERERVSGGLHPRPRAARTRGARMRASGGLRRADARSHRAPGRSARGGGKRRSRRAPASQRLRGLPRPRDRTASIVAPRPGAGYIADVLLGALATELVLYQRRDLGMPQDELKRRWRELVHTLAASGCCHASG